MPPRIGSSHPNIASYDRYTAADGEIFLGLVNDGQFRRFCACVERAEIERTPTELAAAPLFETLMRPGVPAGPVNDVAQALTQLHEARSFLPWFSTRASSQPRRWSNARP